MKISEYNIDLEKVVHIIKEKGYKIIALQLPEGLKGSSQKIVEFLEKESSCTIILLADPCFGACDIVNYELKNLGIEFVIQIGHTPISDLKTILIPTIFVNAFSSRKVTQAVEKSISLLVGTKIGIVTTAQHLHTLEIVEKILEKHNFKPIVCKGDNRISNKGQILGCNFSSGMYIADKVDSFLFVGSGNFHPVGLLISSKKPVVAADPYTNSVKKLELEELKDTILRQRYGAIALSKNAKNFGILIGIKNGQQRMEMAHKIKYLIDSVNKKSSFIAMENFSPASLHGFRYIDCFVSTSCPRIAIDDYLQYKTPILTPVELEITLGKRRWEDYIFDQIKSGPEEI